MNEMLFNTIKTVFALAAMQGKNCCVVPIGRRSAEFFARRGIPALTVDYAQVEDVTADDCAGLGDRLARAYLAGEFDELFVVYTNFVSMLSQQPAVLPLLPLEKPSGPARSVVSYEPDAASVYNAIVPDYLAGVLWCAVCESFASELGARRTAMDSASKNADAMISELSLHYNRARQAAITQEITEIVAGSGE
jgi:F-type H+-transporting ATPase subunit gamma